MKSRPTTGNITWKRKLQYIALLFVLCAFGCCLVSFTVLANGGGPVWYDDGMSCYVNGLATIGIVIRGAIKGLFAGNGLSIQQFIPTVGYGGDVTAICQIWDPLNWLAAFVPVAYTEYLYYALIIVRTFFAALAFSMYCFNRGVSKRVAVIGSLVYVLSGYAMFWAILRHPNFLNVMYILPLVALGCDKLLKREKPTWFILPLALSFVLSSYFTFMVAEFVVVYCLVMYFSSEEKHTLGHFFSTVARFLGSAILALMISAVASLPYILCITSLDRVSVGRAIPVLHQFTYYAEYLTNIIGSVGSYGSHLYIGPFALLILVVFVLFKHHYPSRVWGPWFGLVAAVFICTLIPFLEHVIHGFSYVTDRWFFIFDFVVAYSVCLTIPVLQKLTKAEWRRVLIVCVVLAVLATLPVLWRDKPAPIILSVLSFVLTIVLTRIGIKRFDVYGTTMLICLEVLGGALLTSFLVCAPGILGGDYQKEFLNPIGSAQSFYTDKNRYDVAKAIPAEERLKTRYSIPRSAGSRYLNESLNQKRIGLSYFTGSYNQSIDTFRDELGISDSAFSNMYAGSDCRFAIDAFSGARYFVAPNNETWRVPATYQSMDKSKNDHTLYQTEYALPLGFISDKVIGRQEYSKLSMVEKQDALVARIVLPDDYVDANSTTPFAPSAKTLDVTIKGDDGITFEGSKITVNKENSKLHLSFERMPDSEVYLCFSNLKYTDGPEAQLPENASLIQRVEALDRTPRHSFVITAKTTIGTRTVKCLTPSHIQYCGKDDWAIHCGYSESGIEEIELSFNATGTYSFDSLTVESQPIEPLCDDLSNMQKSGVDNLSWSKDFNSLQATAKTESDSSYALFTLAYSKGWSATVDNKPVEVIPGDTGFVAIHIEGSGEHAIQLNYVTPGLVEGCVVSLIGVIVLVAIIFVRRLNNRRLKEPESSFDEGDSRS